MCNDNKGILILILAFGGGSRWSVSVEADKVHWSWVFWEGGVNSGVRYTYEEGQGTDKPESI